MFTSTKYHSQSYEWNWKEWNHRICPSVAAAQQGRRKNQNNIKANSQALGATLGKWNRIKKH